MAKVKVYRVGTPEVGNHSDEILSFWGAMDAMKPAEHPSGRANSIYVGPNAHSMLRWVRSCLMMRRNVEVYEITVESDDVYCYEIPAYEMVPTYSFDSERFTNATENFWKSGKTLTDWLASNDSEQGHEAEILLNPESILSVKRLSYLSILNRVKAVAKYEGDVLDIKRSRESGYFD